MVVVRQFIKALPFVSPLWLACSFLVAGAPLAPMHGENDGKIPRKSIVRIFLSKESTVFVGGQLVTDSKIHEVVESKGLLLSRDGYVVSYVGNYLPELSFPEVETSVETWTGNRFKAKPVAVDERLSLIFLKTDIENESIPLSADDKPAHFNIISVGAGDWSIARPCLYAWQQKSSILPISKMKVSGLNLEAANWQGGVVVDLNGALVGLVTDVSPHLTSKNLSYFYMIPALAIEAAYARIRKEKRDLLAGWLGVFLEEQGKYIEVTQVVPNSPAEQGGLQPADRLLELDETELEGLVEFSTAIRWRGPGQRARVTVERQGHIRHLELTLTTRPRENLGWRVAMPEKDAADSDSRMRIYRTRIPPLLEFGLVIEPLARRMGEDSTRGLLVQQVRSGSHAEALGLKVGDVIVGINENNVSKVQEVEWALLEAREPIPVRLIRDGKKLTLVLKLQDRK